MQKIYNLKLSPPDRDIDLLTYTSTKLPKKIDYRNKYSVIYDQANLGSCTACAMCYAYQYLGNKTPSRLFLYYNERVLDNNNHVSIDDGSTLSQGINSLTKHGVCNEVTWPYVVNKSNGSVANWATKPTTDAYTEGLKYKLIKANKVKQNLLSLKGCLNDGFPFVCGILVYSSFESNSVAFNGRVPMPNTRKERLLGGHAIICVGYDDSIQSFIMLNSWGTGWGVKGSFYLPYKYLTDTFLSADFWRITNINKPVFSPVINKSAVLSLSGK